MLTQAFGLFLATPTQWRLVLLISCALSLAQIVFSPFVVETPAWLARKGLSDQEKNVGRKLWGIAVAVPTEDSSDPLLDPESRIERDPEPEPPRETAITIPQLLKAKELRRPLLIIIFAMLSQQLSGKSYISLILRTLTYTSRHQRRPLLQQRHPLKGPPRFRTLRLPRNHNRQHVHDIPPYIPHRTSRS